ncbi:bifunctional UDP-N-acetylglucosamine diphosphorylase/glucosamine-1-phosphate N-acetyltransferase GlmU [Mycetocola sp. JXN-3]|uniref:bifunctional UDP-N-acetylglucosamine diphosphorylase/glucosamine-1-phosphate N-acetyltransferase GlmU n=1 Tax=Mycetocola sp. JXN-3 TaxID=2116510 RepID=UPI00165CEE76|nr:bifunctional UDP-N-acetylglucosamine diphosphorylase/glucosamine-1-phosphate N-acetyltransferase GlmU [Mycetocola sp. JXN-3]
MTDSQLAVIVLAAGQGTRMKSRTPKVLHPLGGRTVVGHVIEAARRLEAAHVLAVVRHERDLVAASITEQLPETIIVDQDEVPGTGRAVELAVAALPEGFAGDVLVLNGDVPLLTADTLADLIADHRGTGASATILSAILDDATGYGRIIRTEAGDLDRIVEHKDANETELASREINAGIYLFGLAALREQLAALTTDNAQGEKYVTDVLGLLRAAGSAIAALPVSDAWEVEGINDRVQLAAAAARLNSVTIERWQRAGVTVQDPRTTWIDVQATLAPDVTLKPGTQILGPSVIESDAVIGPDTTLFAVEVGEGAEVKRTEASHSVIGAGATVGPFTFLRPGTILGANGKIGGFVETKNAKIGAGSKVPHLSYVGDATIGEETNIGAGTIFANYDGVNKAASTVGSHVRIGSHSVVVAPVTIGDGAYSGAGTVVRKDVPAGSLAINVSPQRNLEGWTESKRPGSAAALAAEAANSPTANN